MKIDVPTLGVAEVHVWTVPIEAGGAPDRAAALLAPEEARQAERFRFAADRARYITGRFAARALIAAYAGLPEPAALRFTPGPHGKPGIEPAPAVHFNWSHAGDYVLVAITGAAEVGVDIERTDRFTDMDAVARRVFSSVELADYTAHEGEARRIAFFNGWTRKEAFIKATGEGMTRALSGFDVAIAPDEQPCVRRIADSGDDAARWSLHAFTPSPGYVAAVAVRAPAVQLRVMAWPARP